MYNIKYINNIFESKNIDMLYFASFTSIGAFCGFPTLSMPIGFKEKQMPIGTFFLTQKYREDILINYAYSIEKELNINIDPLKK